MLAMAGDEERERIAVAASHDPLRLLWVRVRLHVWAVFCALDDYYGIPRIGGRRAKDG